VSGVDHADQMATLCELVKIKQKWWRNFFFRMLMNAVHNSLILFCEAKHTKPSVNPYTERLAQCLIQGFPRFLWPCTPSVFRHTTMHTKHFSWQNLS